MHNNNYNLLIQKLDEFIRKYYLNQLLRGLIYSGTVLLAAFLTINIIEYLFYLPSTGRMILSYGFLLTGIGILVKWVFIPAMKYLQLGKVISHEQAAQIIGTHFEEVSDKLLNVLQLQAQSQSSSDRSLIEAGINQKIEGLKPVPFQLAVNLGENKKYLKYLALPAVIFIIILFAAPQMITDSSTRLIYSNREFERPAPFTFILQNEDLRVTQGDNLELVVETEGSVMPDQVYIRSGQLNQRMRSDERGRYTYTLSNIQSDQQFHFHAAGFNSNTYNVEVFSRPLVLNFDIDLDYPSYTGRSNETLKNTGDLNIPEGTEVTWSFHTQHTDEIRMTINDSVKKVNRSGQDLFHTTTDFRKDSRYTISVYNKNVGEADAITYRVRVIPDQHPNISVEEFRDSTLMSYMYFAGEASDDYGLTRLNFAWEKVTEREAPKGNYERERIQIPAGQRNVTFNHYVDFREWDLKPGDRIQYFFEVWDNDGINGPKATRTPVNTFRIPSMREIEEITAQSNESVKESMSGSMEKSRELSEEINSLKERLFERSSFNWEDQQAMEDLLNRQKDMRKDVEDLQKEYEENLKRQEEFKDMRPEIAEKHKKLQELFDRLLDDETRALMEEIEKLLEQLDRESAIEKLSQMEMSEKELEQEMDRLMSLFKQLELEQKMKETTDKLSDLAQQQEQLSDDTKSGEQDSESLAEEQQRLQDELDDISKSLDDVEKMANDAGQPMSMEEMREMLEQASQQMQQSQDQLQQDNQQGSSPHQDNAKDQLNDMAMSMQMMQESMMQDQMDIDMQAIRQLLENILKVSFDQEDLIKHAGRININNPEYVKLVQDQFTLKDDAKMIEDSLFALSKRVFQLETFINDEIREINRNMEAAIDHLDERRVGQARSNQQFIMTGFNNLALMLSEALESMQEQMAAQMAGTQMCQKQGGQQGMQQLSQMQQELSERMKQMMQEMQEQGKSPQSGEMSQELAEMAARQQAIRRALQEHARENMGSGDEHSDEGKLRREIQEAIQEMDQIEKDLVFRELNEEMIRRQEEILVRMLEAAEAERQQDQEEQRVGEVAEERERRMPPSLEEYLEKRQSEVDLYRTVPPALRPYYKNMVEKYFQSLTF